MPIKKKSPQRELYDAISSHMTKQQGDVILYPVIFAIIICSTIHNTHLEPFHPTSTSMSTSLPGEKHPGHPWKPQTPPKLWSLGPCLLASSSKLLATKGCAMINTFNHELDVEARYIFSYIGNKAHQFQYNWIGHLSDVVKIIFCGQKPKTNWISGCCHEGLMWSCSSPDKT